jgi:hypothetical protein
MISHPQMSPSAVRFFAIFSRFEFALKATDYLGTGRIGREVKADWQKFASSIGVSDVFGRLEQDADARYLVRFPPKIRVVDNGRLVWSTTTPQVKNLPDVCGMILRVRNNLFHGDKSGGGSERDEQLLIASIRALELMLEANDRVRDAYHSDAG